MEKKLSSGNVLNPSISFPHALLISASAGSGKTYALAQRYSMFLLSSETLASAPKRPENIIAVTFTNNAAKEMKQRILKYLKELAVGKNRDENKICLALGISPSEAKIRAKSCVMRLLDSYSDFQVYTIDSFFSGIFRLSAAELNYSPDIETVFSMDSIVSSGIESIASMAGKPGIFNERVADAFLSRLPRGKSFIWNPVARMKDVFSKMMKMEASLSYEMKLPDNENSVSARKAFDDFKKEYERIIAGIPKELIRKNLSDPELIKDISYLLKNYPGKCSFFNGNKKNKIQKEIPCWERLKARADMAAASATEAYSFSYYNAYSVLYEAFRAKTEIIKRNLTNSIPLSDISKSLAEYINSSTVPEIYYNLGSRLNHFMIDEFQDTNRLQWNVMLPLIEEALSGRGSLFMVGDIKQAIYRFRNADYKIMASMMSDAGKNYSGLETRMLANGIECENLPDNHRSGGIITSYVERLFKGKLPLLFKHYGLEDRTGLTSYEQRPLPEAESKGYVRCDIIEKNPRAEDSEGNAKPVYAEKLINYVKSASLRWPYRDIAVLAHKNEDVKKIVGLLSAAGIPAASFSSLDIRSRPIISEIFALLKFLDNPADDISFFNFLKGSVFQKNSLMESSSIAELMLEQENKSIHHRAKPLYAVFREARKDLWERFFDPLFKKSGYLPLYELTGLVYETFNLFSLFGEEHSALVKFLEVVSASSSKGMNDLGNFLDYAFLALGKNADEDSKTQFSISLPETMDAVQVMTWHKSKGLGYPVVINILDNADSRKDSVYFFYDDSKGCAFPFYSTQPMQNISPLLNKLKKEEDIEELMQNLNVFYVVCTRAKEELYNIVLRKPPLKNNKKEEKDLDLPDPLDIFEGYEAGAVSSEESIKERNKGKDSGEAACLMDVKSRPAGEISLNESTASLPESNYSQRLRGELLHAVISAYNPNGSNLRSELDKLYEKFRGFFGPEEEFSKEEDISLIEKFLKDPAVKPFFDLSSGTVECESEYLDQEGGLIRIDRAVKGPHGIMVVDFKTGNEHGEKYKKQLRHYMRALSQVHGLPVRGFLAYLSPVKVEEVFDCGKADI